MNKKYAVCFLLLWPFLIAFDAMAQGSYTATRHFDHLLKKHSTNRTTIQRDTLKAGGGGVASDTLWYIRSTAKDTSRVYESSPWISLWYVFNDTSNGGAGDSVGQKIILHMAPETEYKPGSLPPYGQFVRVDSVTVTNESRGFWNITSNPIPEFRWMYFTLTGTATNKKLSSVKGRLKVSHWSEILRQ